MRDAMFEMPSSRKQAVSTTTKPKPRALATHSAVVVLAVPGGPKSTALQASQPGPPRRGAMTRSRTTPFSDRPDDMSLSSNLSKPAPSGAVGPRPPNSSKTWSLRSDRTTRSELDAQRSACAVHHANGGPPGARRSLRQPRPSTSCVSSHVVVRATSEVYGRKSACGSPQPSTVASTSTKKT